MTRCWNLASDAFCWASGLCAVLAVSATAQADDPGGTTTTDLCASMCAGLDPSEYGDCYNTCLQVGAPNFVPCGRGAADCTTYTEDYDCYLSPTSIHRCYNNANCECRWKPSNGVYRCVCQQVRGF